MCVCTISSWSEIYSTRRKKAYMYERRHFRVTTKMTCKQLLLSEIYFIHIFECITKLHNNWWFKILVHISIIWASKFFRNWISRFESPKLIEIEWVQLMCSVQTKIREIMPRGMMIRFKVCLSNLLRIWYYYNTRLIFICKNLICFRVIISLY